MPDPDHAPATDVTGLILAGGHSRRFGTDKARHEVAGRSMIERAHGAVRAVTGRAALVSVRAGQEPFDALRGEGARYIEDAAPEAGPLAGLVAGLRAAETTWLLALACDLPFASAQALRPLLAARRSGADAVVATAPDGRLQPLCACYRRTVALPLAETHLRGGRLALHALLEALPTRRVRLDARALRNINRPSDL